MEEGFLYSEGDLPSASSLDRIPEGERVLYRHLTGSWYLFVDID
jgi:hypothetical protein